MRVQVITSLALLALALPAPAQQGGGKTDEQPKRDPFGTLFGERQDGGEEEALPDDPVPRADALLRAGRHDEAEAILRADRARGPRDPAALPVLCRLLMKQGRLDEAQREATTLRDLDPRSPRGLMVLGEVALAIGDLEGAERAWRGAWSISRADEDEAFLEATTRLGAMLLEGSKFAEAAGLLERTLTVYQKRNRLGPMELVWVARACRALDTVPSVKSQYSKKMAEYARLMLDQALALDPRCVEAFVEGGTLALLKHDVPQAKKAFEKACDLDPNHPDARVGLARALLAQFYSGEGKFGDAARNLQVALAACPSHAGAQATLAAVAVTDGELQKALEHAEAGLRDSPEDPGLLAMKASVVLLRADKPGFEAIVQQVLARRPRCARFFHEVAELITLKFRYAEARDLCRRALEVDPGYHPVMALLGVSLSRTGDEEEGRRVLQLAWEQDPYDLFTYNSLELFDRLEKNYVTIEHDGFVIRLHKKEQQASARYVTSLLAEARARLGAKYGGFPERVLVELFPEHADFSARSVGIPGIPALGVCFGNVVTVLSANERDAVGAHAWGRTTWHELTHVATLTRTQSRIPRWLTEGLSVYEESRGRPTWLRDYDREIMMLMKRQLLLPLRGFDAGFTKPKYPAQVIMSYYQGGMLCEFVEATWGFGKVLALLDQYRAGKDTAEAVEAAFGLSPEEVDRRFLSFLERRYAPFAFAAPPGDEERQALLERVRLEPWDVSARGELARCYLLQGNRADAEAAAGLALEHAGLAATTWGLVSGIDAAAGEVGATDLALARARGLQAGAADAWLVLGLIDQQRGRLDRSRRRLDRALDLGTRDPVLAHQGLAAIWRARKRWPRAIRHLEAVARLTPPTPDSYRALFAAHQQNNDQPAAMAALRRVCALASDDAKARMEYAGWAREQGRWTDVAEVLDDVNLVDPFIAEAHLLLGEALRRTKAGDAAALARALEEYQAALDLNVVAKAGALFGQAACLDGLGRKDEALAKVEAALEVDPDLEEAQQLQEKLKAGR